MFTRFNLGVQLPYTPDLILCFLAFFEIEGTVGSTDIYRVRDLSKAVRHSRAQRYTCFGVPTKIKYALQMWLRRLEMCVADGELYSEGL